MLWNEATFGKTTASQIGLPFKSSAEAIEQWNNNHFFIFSSIIVKLQWCPKMVCQTKIWKMRGSLFQFEFICRKMSKHFWRHDLNLWSAWLKNCRRRCWQGKMVGIVVHLAAFLLSTCAFCLSSFLSSREMWKQAVQQFGSLVYLSKDRCFCSFLALWNHSCSCLPNECQLHWHVSVQSTSKTATTAEWSSQCNRHPLKNHFFSFNLCHVLFPRKHSSHAEPPAQTNWVFLQSQQHLNDQCKLFI